MPRTNDDRKHVSHSQISLLMQCPRKYKYRYIDELTTPCGPQLVLGSSYHKGLEVNFKQKIESGIDLGIEQVITAYEAEWKKKLADTDIVWGDKIPGEVHDAGIALLRAYMDSMAPFVMPVDVEREFFINLPGIEGYAIKGYIDLITDAGVIVDHKTASKSKNQKDCDKDLQPYVYAATLFEDPTLDEAPFEFHVAVNKKTPEIQCVRTMRTRADVEWYIGLLAESTNLIRSGIFPPNPTGWWCCPEWCGYHGRCKGGKC